MYQYAVEFMELTDALLCSWRWKQIAVGNDLEAMKRITGDRGRVIDLTTFDELFRTAPDKPKISMFC
jgi:hypothetical protein